MIDGKRNQETNAAIRTEVTGKIESDLVTTTAIPNLNEGQDHAREIGTGDVGDETMSVRGRGRGRETEGDGGEVETGDGTAIMLIGGRLTTIGRVVGTKIAEGGAAVGLVRRMLDGAVAMIGDTRNNVNEVRH